MADIKNEAMKWTHYLLDQAGGSNPQWFSIKNYPKEFRKRGNAMFDNLH